MLARRAADFRDDHTAVVNSWPEFTAAVAVGWALALHCGGQACEEEIKAETTATPRCIPLDGQPEQGTCVRCGKPSGYGKRVIFARAY
jgi:prolyl-tRNA synthetase